MANLMGFNAIINTIRSQHTDSMETIGTEKTNTKYNDFLNKSSSTTTINTQTMVNNVFQVKGVLAVIGKEDQTNGIELSDEIFEQDCIERYNCVRTLQNVYWSNQELKTLTQKHKKYEIYMIIGFFVSPFIAGPISFAIYFLISWFYYSTVKNNENKTYEMLASMEPDLKAFVEKFGEGLFDVYQLSPYITLKHVGE